EVDPIRYNLYFERFLNYSRGKPPDIDLDFNWRFRDRMLEYIYRRYGEDRVAMMSSIHTMHARGALREVAKAYGISERELDTFRKYIPHTLAKNLEVLGKKYPEAKNLKLNSDLYQTILKTAAQLDGFPHYSGIHSSGVVITEKPVTHCSALERSANGFVKTQLDMYSGEDVGLIKFDVLAVRGLGTIEDAVKNIEKEQGQSIDIFNWGKIFADEKAKELMSTGKTIGAVHAESPFIRNAMRITKAQTFELLYIILGMVRTGCVESGMMYTFIERLLNPEKRKDALPALVEILPETFGVMIFEEDVIKVLHYVGSLTLEESDMVRRYMSGKRVSAKIIQELKTKFFRNCGKKIDSRKEIETLWKQIESFSGFSFCKAHSASYALMAFQGLYLKIHYPAHYMAAVLSNEGGFYSASAYISECRRLGLTILPPDINLSGMEYKATGNAVRIGLRFIAGIGSKSLNNLLKAREEKPYDSLQDFVFRSGAEHEEIVSLIKIGCFDAFNKKRTLLIALLDAIIHIQKSRLSQEMFSLDLTHYEQMLSHLDDMTIEEKLIAENDLLSYFVAQHPLEFFPKQINSPSVIKAKDLSRCKNKKVKMIGWLVSAKRIRTRDKQDEQGNIREGQYMKFMTLEDLTGIYDTVLFPRIYARMAEHTLSYGPFCVEGIVDERYNTVNVTRIALVRNKLPQMDIDASLTIEKQEVYAKQKSDSDTYDDDYIVPIEMETIELQIIKAS
ncbi:DNA polymerase III subunit alpha, partial [bacterium]|nr:DNA polymerase III subunit alpha [bacterium]